MKNHISITDQNAPITEADLLRAEERLGTSLPNEYRKFLLANNGGEPTPDIFPLPEHPLSSHNILNRFLCLEEGDIYDIFYMRDILSDRLPNGFLPIAIDPGGNLICIGIHGKRHSKIFFCPLDEGDSGEMTVYQVANTFTEFLYSLKSSSEDN